MFARFRQSCHRVHVSLVETRRVDGRVRHQHVASLGSIVAPADTAGRIAFWHQLRERLARLANRIDPDIADKILGAVHARIAMPTPDEIRALQLEYAAADERFWSQLAALHESSAAENTGLRGMVEAKIAEASAGAKSAQERAAAAKDRAARLQYGEAVAGGLAKPMTRAEMLKMIGWNESDVYHANRLGLIDDVPGGMDLLSARLEKGRRRREKGASLAVLKELVLTGKVSLD
jgi:hypothetical protein